MTTSNNTFSHSRFGFYLRKHIVENRKKLIQFSIQIFLTLVLLLDINPWLQNVYRIPSKHDLFWGMEFGWLGFTFIVLMGTIGAMMYNSVENKGERIATLMTPASSFEKFLSYFMIYGIGLVVLFILCFYMTDYIRVWTSAWYANPDATVLPLPMDYILTSGHNYKFHDIVREVNDPSSVTNGVLQFLIYLFVVIMFNAFNVLGSIVWNKRPFIKTFGTLFALNTVCGFFMYQGWKLFFGYESLGRVSPRPMFEMLSAGDVCWIVGISTLILSSVIYYISYVRFKETEIINRW